MRDPVAPLLRSIVVAVDFSEASAHAVRVAGHLAGRFGASLRLVHAETIEAPPYFTEEQIAALEAQRRAARAQAERYLAAFGHRETGVPFDAAIETYPPVESILRLSSDADLLVMGTHGRRGPARWWLGSVAERVLREIDRPLLVVRATGAPPVRIGQRVDVRAFEGAGEAAMAWAHTLAGDDGGVVDRRQAPEAAPAVERGTTLVAMAVPEPRTPRWLARHAEPWLRAGQVPVLFVPDRDTGGVP